MLDREVVERLGEDLGGLQSHVALMKSCDESWPVLERTVNALPELLRVYRAWLDAPAVDVEADGFISGFVDASMKLDGQRIRLVRDGDSGEGE